MVVVGRDIPLLLVYVDVVVVGFVGREASMLSVH